MTFREFYLHLDWEPGKLNVPISSVKIHKTDVHVIEYAAYEESNQKWNDITNDLQLEIDTLQAQNKLMRNALRYYTNNQKAGAYTGLAKEVLAQIEKDEK